jgi:RNA polymerase sigma factor (sigma-70 family)
MMSAVLPPFELVYREHRDAVYAFLRGRLRDGSADDAFQETFLRALRGYGSLRHGRELRAWLLTIASRVVIDGYRHSLRQPSATENAVHHDREPAYAELAHLADDLPPTERAAVVLRYGYDLEYAEIGVALGSSAEAARQAASAGVRRLRRRMSE